MGPARIPSGDAGPGSVEPVTHDPAGLLGLGQVHGVAAARDQGSDAVRDEPGQAQSVRGEAVVVRPRQSKNGEWNVPS